MRKHDVRKWLHAVLDLLPVILIPVFMIYSHRHDVTQDFVKSEEVPVYYETNEVTSISDLVVGNIYSLSYSSDINYATEKGILCNAIYLRGTSQNYNQYNNFTAPYISLYNRNIFFNATDSNQNNKFQLTSGYLDFVFKSLPSSFIDDVSLISSCSIQYVKEYHTVSTTIPHDVMTSFMDRFNNTINEYFNMGNVFNLSGVYDWFNTNIFSGHAPTVIYSIWNIALYELVMDLLFLLYGLFMWFIDMVQKLMEKPLNSVR